MAVDAITELEDIQAAGLIHPSLWKTEDAKKIFKPALLLPTKDEEDMVRFTFKPGILLHLSSLRLYLKI